MDAGLIGRVAFVSGGSGAIGTAIAAALAGEGAAVAVSWRTGRERAEAVAATITEAGGRAIPMRLDQRDSDSAAQAMAEVAQVLGPVSVLVANAVQWPEPDPDEAAGLTVSLQANTVGPLALVTAALPGMRDQGWGRIVLVSSDVVEQPMPGPLSYATAKGALETAARVLAVREAGHGILTNVVRPGFTLTERARTSPFLGPDVIARESAKTPTGRICTPEDVASAVTYLVSAANGHVNGQVLSVAGGRELVR